MKHSSIGYHTFNFFSKYTAEFLSEITGCFMTAADNSPYINRFPLTNSDGKNIGWEYYFKGHKGIRWQLVHYDIKGYTFSGIRTIINPKALIYGNYLTAANEQDLYLTEQKYDAITKKFSLPILKFKDCSLSRADYCVNFDVSELGLPCTAEQMIQLFKRGDIPSTFTERKVYDQNSHRWISEPYSLYLKQDSVNINCYWKYPQLNEKYPTFEFKDYSKDVVRFEVQCKYTKLYSMIKGINTESKYTKICKRKRGTFLPENISVEDFIYNELSEDEKIAVHAPKLPIDVGLSNKISNNIVSQYYQKIVGTGDYLTLDGARKVVQSHEFRADKEKRLLWALELISLKRGIAKAKEGLDEEDSERLARSINDLNSILINPVTIPCSWNILHIKNPMRAFEGLGKSTLMHSKSERKSLDHIYQYLRTARTA